MQTHYERYAIYFAPRPDTELAEFGREWLGMDAEQGFLSAAPSPYAEAPRRYGFHATLKAPMRLSDKYTYFDLQQSVKQLASHLIPVSLGELQLERIGSFLALTTSEKFHPAVSELAWVSVTELDHLRATLNDAERNKRKKLSPSEQANLERWGYPYVGDQFRFHMTLTSSLDDEALKVAREELNRRIPISHVKIDSICIFGDPGETKPFSLLERFDLKGSRQSK